MINMFYDNKWKIATRSNIGCDIRFNHDVELTFRDMFLEAFTNKGLEFDMFSKKYSYSFVLQHPKNRIVVPFNKTNIILTNVYECNGLNVKEVDIKNKSLWISETNEHLIETPKNIETVLNIENATIDSVANIIGKGVDYTIQGAVILCRYMGVRTKIRNQNYENVRILKGNSPKLQYQYYNLRQYDRVKEFLKFYPEYGEKFSNLREQLHKWTNNLRQNYIDCYVKKTKPLKEYPFEFRTHMFNLHKIYLNELRSEGLYINKPRVIKYINNLPPDHLMCSINYPLKIAKINEKKNEMI